MNSRIHLKPDVGREFWRYPLVDECREALPGSPVGPRTYEPGGLSGLNTLSAVLAGWLLLTVATQVQAQTNLYSTSFERSEGYDPAYELVGQKGWVTDSRSYGGNGLITNFLGTQAAYVGQFSLNPPASSFSVWQPLNYGPLTSGLPVVKFSVLMSVIDSTTNQRDDFYWSVFNSQGQRLFTLDFYNVDLGIYYVLDDTNGFVSTGHTFTNDVPYTVQITMDFSHSLWSATLNGSPLVANLPMTTTGAKLDLGDIDAVWGLSETNNPGDNLLIFDDYQVTAEAAVPVRLQSLGGINGGPFLLRLTGPSGVRYAIDASTNLVQWTALKTNTVTDGSFDYIDSSAPGFSKRFYRARQVP